MLPVTGGHVCSGACFAKIINKLFAAYKKSGLKGETNINKTNQNIKKIQNQTPSAIKHAKNFHIFPEVLEHLTSVKKNEDPQKGTKLGFA